MPAPRAPAERRAAWPFAAMLLMLVVAAIGTAQAAAFRDIRYDGALTLDVYAPDRPGPHAVIAFFDGDGDKAQARVMPQAFVERGYLLAVVGFRGAGDDAGAMATRDVSAALTFVTRQISSYGGDRARLFAWGRGAGAVALARIAGAPERLVALGAPADALRGVVLSVGADGIDASLPTTTLALPPRLLLVDAREASRAIVTHGESLRALGCDVQVVPMPQADPVGAATDDAAAYALAWLESQGFDRLQRVEHLRFARFRTGIAPLPHVPDLVVGSDGALYAAARGHAGVWRAAAPQAPWQREAGLEALTAIRDLVAIEPVRATGDAADGARPAALLALADARDRVVLRVRDGDDWRDLPMPSTTRLDRARRVFVARDDGAAATTWLAVGDGVFRLARTRGAWRLDPVAASPGAIAGLALIDGAPIVATLGTDGGALQRWHDDGGWERLGSLASWDVRDPLDGFVAVPDPADPSRDVLLLGTGSRVLRIDPARRGRADVEIDLRTTMNDQWRALGGGRARLLAPGFVRVVQPEGGERLWVAGVALPHPDPARGNAWYLVRRAAGNYAYGRAEDVLAPASATLPHVVPSPYPQHAGRALLFFGENGEAVAGWFDRARPRMGLWRDRGDPQRAAFVARRGDAGIVYVLGAGRDGPGWSIAQGAWRDDAFVADRAGLARLHRDAVDAAPRRRDDARQEFALRFDVAPDDPACAAIDRRDASALAVMTVGVAPAQARWCLEPVDGATSAALAGSTGLWDDGTGEAGWTLAIDRGASRDADAHLLLFTYDAAGEPRWLEGTGRIDEGRVAATLRAPLACRDCAHADAAGAGTAIVSIEGPCPDRSGFAQIDLADGDGRAVLVLRGERLARAAGGACY